MNIPITRVLIVDDQPRARQGLAALLATCPDVLVIGEAADGAQALDLAQALRPDLVLMDARMPGIDGLEATRLMKTRWPQTRVIILSIYDCAAEARAAGADAFVSKGAPPAELLGRLAEITRGGVSPARWQSPLAGGPQLL